ncbi:aromatic amino acid aminotransferase [Ceratocystis lukuohia]|uniref:Aromatic amino acid aminotransferase n=1 Tax=Ceratocystis lukuohia TaxID=2019550 RepID=A0ABR4MM56_9PEZI
MDALHTTADRDAGADLVPPRDLSHLFSEVTTNRQPSQIKAYYKFFQIPGIGNIAAGLPHVSLFPFDTLEANIAPPTRWTPSASVDPNCGPDPANLSLWSGVSTSHITVPKTSVCSDITTKIDLASALQYGTSDGYPALRSFLRQFTRDVLHPNFAYKGGPEIILTCGSTDGFNKALQLLVNSWSQNDPVGKREGILVEKYMYSNVLAQAKPLGVNIASVELDDQGLVAHGPGSLDDVLASWDETKGKRPHILYTVTTGHNPTSGVLSVQRRKEIYTVACKYDIIIVEDDPYWYLQFPSSSASQAKSRDQPVPSTELLTAGWTPTHRSGYRFIDSLVPSFLQFDTEGRVIRLDTFSKTIAPGCRLGWITAQPAFIERFMCITEATTQQPSGFVQSMVATLLLGSQPPAVMTAYQRLTRYEQALFSGWNMDGWVRWLAGLNGAYERRMSLMSRIIDQGTYQLKQSTPIDPVVSDWGVITKTRLLSFNWPQGGMFLWLRIHFENHPLWRSRGTENSLITGPMLSTALLVFLMDKPFLVLASPGLMFSANDQIREESGWRFFRLCFAAEDEDKIESITKRFVDGVQRFWRIKDPAEVKRLVKKFSSPDSDTSDLNGAASLASPMNC